MECQTNGSQMKTWKIFVMSPPATGHVNPMCSLVYELLAKDDLAQTPTNDLGVSSPSSSRLNVIFYGEEFYREQIEKTGAQFRPFPTRKGIQSARQFVSRPVTEKRITVGEIVHGLLNNSFDLLPQLVRDVSRDEPDLIIYDNIFLPAKYMLEVIARRRKTGTWTSKVPASVAFFPNFPVNRKMVKIMREHSSENVWSVLASLANAFRRQAVLSWTHGMRVLNPVSVMTAANRHVNIVAVLPELQPYRDEFNASYKFVGPCASESARSHEIKEEDTELNELLAQFDRNEDGDNDSELKLIYMSLGSVFCNNYFVYERAIEALKQFDELVKQQPRRSPKSTTTAATTTTSAVSSSRRQFRVIMSVGEEGERRFNEMISSGQLDVSGLSLLIRASVPQLAVLKRAHLFITHSGMNSSSEAIKYGVPVVCIPIEADQPLNARRVCDELGLGVRLDPFTLNARDLAAAIHQVLGDERFRRNAATMSKVAARHNGSVEAARIVLDYLNKQVK